VVQEGHVASIVEYNYLYDILGRSKQWPQCKAIYEQMVTKGIAPNKYTYGILVHSAAVAAPWAEVW